MLPYTQSVQNNDFLKSLFINYLQTCFFPIFVHFYLFYHYSITIGFDEERKVVTEKKILKERELSWETRTSYDSYILEIKTNIQMIRVRPEGWWSCYFFQVGKELAELLKNIEDKSKHS
jgi:hypothetical protein